MPSFTMYAGRKITFKEGGTPMQHLQNDVLMSLML